MVASLQPCQLRTLTGTKAVLLLLSMPTVATGTPRGVWTHHLPILNKLRQQAVYNVFDLTSAAAPALSALLGRDVFLYG
jgi:hypothetical protein